MMNCFGISLVITAVVLAACLVAAGFWLLRQLDDYLMRDRLLLNPPLRRNGREWHDIEKIKRTKMFEGARVQDYCEYESGAFKIFTEKHGWTIIIAGAVVYNSSREGNDLNLLRTYPYGQFVLKSKAGE